MRIAGSSGANPFACIAAGIACLWGPAHGGANEAALAMLAGIGTVEVRDPGKYTMYPDGYPDFPMAQLLETKREQQRVTVSCLVSNLRFEWRLEPAGEGTLITVDVDVPEAEAHRLHNQRQIIQTSLRRLAGLA